MFLLALGEDYNILVMTRIREEAQHLPLREAVGRALSVTGTTVTSAGLVLAGTFGVLAIVGSGSAGAQNVRTIVDVGVGLALGVLMDTFLVRTLLVPSAVVLIGRWNWWPSALYRARRAAAREDARKTAPVRRVITWLVPASRQWPINHLSSGEDAASSRVARSTDYENESRAPGDREPAKVALGCGFLWSFPPRPPSLRWPVAAAASLLTARTGPTSRIPSRG